MHRIIVLLAAGIAIWAGGRAEAQGRAFLRGSVDVEVVADGGGTFRTIPFRSFRMRRTAVCKRYLEARPGENYRIVVRNRTAERVGIVIAVDGRNIITGGRSMLDRRESMYILDAGETAGYDGWRTSQYEVHRFFFTEPAGSYAIRTFGDSSAMGLIAVAVFREQDRPRRLFEDRTGRDAPGAAAESAPRGVRKRQAGTGFGTGVHAPVREVAFLSERQPFRKILLKYEWRETLCRKGILRCGGDAPNRLWDDARYAPFPPAE